MLTTSSAFSNPNVRPAVSGKRSECENDVGGNQNGRMKDEFGFWFGFNCAWLWGKYSIVRIPTDGNCGAMNNDFMMAETEPFGPLISVC